MLYITGNEGSAPGLAVWITAKMQKIWFYARLGVWSP